jgi:antitoxin ParD1/3/4
LQQRRREDALKLKALRAQIRVGIEELDRGEFDDVDDRGLDRYLAGLTAKPGKRRR